MEYKIEVGKTTYGMDAIQSVRIEQPLFDKLSIGNACSAQLTIRFWPIVSPPRMAKIVPYFRKSSGSTWVKQGEFFIDTRVLSDGLLEVVAYDAMLKGEVVWEPSQHLSFPMTMPAAAMEISSLMGVPLDSRNKLKENYTIDYPANEYTLRDILRYIAVAHCGNWIITSTGKLLLVPLFSTLPPETTYLVTEDGDPILFGDARILV